MYRPDLILLLVLLFNLSCNYDQSSNAPEVGKADATIDSSASNGKANSPAQTGSIRNVDFSNFTYDWYPKWDGMVTEKKGFTLRDGRLDVDPPSNSNEPWRFELLSVQYGDVTLDDTEEAIVTIKMGVMGNAKPYVVFVLTLANGKPIMLWAHETGDRADEGLRNVYISDGHFLVLEQYNADQLVSSNGEGTKVGMCCPATFTRIFYKWDKLRFRRLRQETVRNEYPDARVLVR